MALIRNDEITSEWDLTPSDTPTPGMHELPFDDWYKHWAKVSGINPNPDDPLHHYDYREAYANRAFPTLSREDVKYHWPSAYKADTHPNLIVNGINTKTGQPVGSEPPQSVSSISEPTTAFKPISYDEVMDEVPLSGTFGHIGSKIVEGFGGTVGTAIQGLQRTANDLAPRPFENLPIELKSGIKDYVKPVPEVEQQAGYKLGAALRTATKDTFGAKPDLEESFWATDVPKALGSTAGFAAATLTGGVGAGILTGMMAGRQSGYEEAKQAGATPEQTELASGLSALVGSMETLPIGVIFGRLDKFTGGKAKQVLLRGGVGGLTEFLQEGSQSVAGNVIARHIYDSNREYFDNAFREGAAGGVSGAILSFVAAGLGIKLRSKKPGVKPVTDSDVDDGSGGVGGGGYSDAEVEARYQEMKHRTRQGLDFRWPGTFETVHESWYGVQEEAQEAAATPPTPIDPSDVVDGPVGSEIEQTTKEAGYDTQDTEGIPSEVGIGTQSVGTQFEQKPGEEAAPAGGILQAPKEKQVKKGRRLGRKVVKEPESEPEVTEEAKRLRTQEVREVDQDFVAQARKELEARKAQVPAPVVPEAAPSAPRPIADERLATEYKTTLRGRLELNRLRKEYPDRDFELKPTGRGTYKIRENLQGLGEQITGLGEPQGTREQAERVVTQMRELYPGRDFEILDTGKKLTVVEKARSTTGASTYASQAELPAQMDARKTAVAILAQAAKDVKGISATEAAEAAKEGLEISPEEAQAWVKDTKSNDFGSFNWIMDTLGFDEGILREGIRRQILSGEADVEAMRDAFRDASDVVSLYTLDPVAFMRGFSSIWNSKMVGVIASDKMPKTVLASEVPGYIDQLLRNGEFKREEWEDTVRLTGFKDWLSRWGDQPIPREVIAAELAQNGIEVEETVYSDAAAYDNPRFKELRDKAMRGGVFSAPEQEEYNTLMWNNPLSKYSVYTLPRGSNYIELVLTSPQAQELPEERLHYAEGPKGRRQIGWVRANERTDADGNQVLFIEEMQSKRHQAGREEGYEDKGSAQYQQLNEQLLKYQEAFSPYIFQLRQKHGITDPYGKQYKEWEALLQNDPVYTKFLEDTTKINQAIERLPDEELPVFGVPDAPFRQSWLRLLARRMVRYAAERGIKKIAWTTGEQQAERWSLRQVADELAYNTETEELIGFKHGIREWKRNIPPDQLPLFVRADLAKQLLAPKPEMTGTQDILDKIDAAKKEIDDQLRAAGVDPAHHTIEQFNTLPEGTRKAIIEEERAIARYEETLQRAKEDYYTVRVPRGVDFYKSKWPEEVYGYQGRLEAPFEGAPLKLVGGYETSLIASAFREAVKPFKVEVGEVVKTKPKGTPEQFAKWVDIKNRREKAYDAFLTFPSQEETDRIAAEINKLDTELEEYREKLDIPEDLILVSQVEEWLSGRRPRPLKSFSTQPSVELTDEMVEHFRSRPTYLYSVDLVAMIKKAGEVFGPHKPELYSAMEPPDKSIKRIGLKSDTQQIGKMLAENVGHTAPNESFANELFQNSLDAFPPGQVGNIKVKFTAKGGIAKQSLPEGWTWEDPKTFWATPDPETKPIMAAFRGLGGDVKMAVEGDTKAEVFEQLTREGYKVNSLAQQPKLEVQDDGTGMTPETVEFQYLMLGGVGTKGTESRGGFGIASSLLLIKPEKIRLNTVTKVGKQLVRTQFIGTREEILSGTGKMKTTVAPEGTPTGTKYEAWFPDGFDLDSMERAFTTYAQGVQTPVVITIQPSRISDVGMERRLARDRSRLVDSYTGLYHVARPIESLPQKAPYVTFDDGKGNSGKIYFVEEEASGGMWADERGFVPIESKVYNKGLPLRIRMEDEFGKFPGQPDFVIKVNFEKTVAPKENLKDYPFINNRTTLRPETITVLRRAASDTLRAISSGHHAKNVNQLKSLVDTSPVINGMKFLLDLDTPEAIAGGREILTKHMDMFADFADIFKSFNDIIQTELNETPIDMAFTFDVGSKKGVYGFHTNTALTGLDIYAFNPVKMATAVSEVSRFEQAVKRGTDPVRIQSSFFTHVFVHEYAHRKVSNHFDAYSWEVAELYGILSHKDILGPFERKVYDFFQKRNPELSECQAAITKLGGKSKLRTVGTSPLAAPGRSPVGVEPEATGGREGGAAEPAEPVDTAEMAMLKRMDPNVYSLLGWLPGSKLGDALPKGGMVDRIVDSYRRHLGVPRWYAKVAEAYGDFYHRNSQITAKWQGKFRDSVEGLDSWLSLSPDEQKSVVDKMWEMEGKRMKAMPSPELEKVEGKDEVKANPAHYEELSKFLLGKGLSDNAVRTAVAIRQSLHQDFVEFYNNLARRPDLDKSVLENMWERVGTIPNYLPHSWYGNHYIEGLNAKGKVVTRLAVDIKLWEKGIGRSKKFKAMMDGFQNDTTPEKQVVRWSQPKESSELEKYYINAPVSVEVMGRVLDEAAAKLEVDPNLAEVAKAFRKALPREVLEILKTRGFSNFAKRGDMGGYETQDLMRVLMDYKSGLYGSLRRTEQAREFARIMLERKPKKAELEAMVQYFEDQMAPQGKLEGIVNKARQIIFLRYMAARAKPACVNLSNAIVTSMPTLGMYAKDTTKTYTKACSDITQQYTQESKQRLRRIGIFGRTDGKNVLSQDEVNLLRKFQEDNTIQPQQVYEMADQLRQHYMTYRGLVSRIFGTGARVGNKIVSAPMEATEWYSRASLALAAARSMSNGQLTQKAILDRFGLQAEEKIPLTDPRVERFAREIVLDTHGEYGQHNRPPLVRTGRLGKLLSIPYTFRHFQHNLGELWASMLKQERGKAAFLKSISGQVAVGGAIKGIPFMPVAMALYAAFSGDDPEEKLRGALPFGEDAKDAVLYGVPAAGIGGLPKVAIGSSVEFSLPESVVEILSGMASGQMPAFREGASVEATGVAGSMVKDIIGGFNAWANGAQDRALEYFAPLVVIRDWLSASRLHKKGQYTLSGKPIIAPGEFEPTKITRKEAIAKSLGFQPLRLEKGFREYQSLHKAEAYRVTAQSRLASRFANAYVNGNEEEALRVLYEVEAWNLYWLSKGMEEYAIDPKKAIEIRLQPERGDKRLAPRRERVHETTYGFEED